MPSWLQPFAENNPFTVMVNAASALFVGTPAGNGVWLACMWGAVITVVCAALLSIRRYRRAVALSARVATCPVVRVGSDPADDGRRLHGST